MIKMIDCTFEDDGQTVTILGEIINYAKIYLNLNIDCFALFALCVTKKLKFDCMKNSGCLAVIVCDDRPTCT